MQELYQIAIVMEMLIVNLVTVDMCARRKYSRLKCFAVLAVFTYILTYFTNGIWNYMGFEAGNAAFALIGIIYLVPLAFLYRETRHYLLSILFSAWIYTMLVYCISVRIAYEWPAVPLVRNVLLAQTVLYALSLAAFSYWIRKGLLFIIHNITRSNRYILQLVSLSWFLSIIIVNANLIYTHIPLLKMSAITAMTANAVLSYLLVYSMVAGHKRIRSLENIVYADNLTGLYNRAKFFEDAPRLIQSGTPFRLVFIDLNQFKKINDRFGHVTGDQYLVSFADSTRSMLGTDEEIYRMSGDEFIIISPPSDDHGLADKLDGYPDTLPGMDIPFLGVSTGFADFPEEADTLDELVALADYRMYQNKPSGRR